MTGERSEPIAVDKKLDIERVRSLGLERAEPLRTAESVCAELEQLRAELAAARKVVEAAEIAAESLGSHCLEWEDSVSELIGSGHSEKAPGRGAESNLRASLTAYREVCDSSPDAQRLATS